MINFSEVRQTNEMIEKENLDVRTITMGISLMDCIDSDLQVLGQKIYDKIYSSAENLVRVGEEISRDYGIPIVNKRISVTPVALVGGSACSSPEDFARIAQVLDKAAHDVGVNFLGGYSALVSKGMTRADRLLIESIPLALSQTELVCSSVNVGSTKTGLLTGAPSDARSWSFSAMRRMTIPSWPARSTALRRRTGSSISA